MQFIAKKQDYWLWGAVGRVWVGRFFTSYDSFQKAGKNAEVKLSLLYFVKFKESVWRVWGFDFGKNHKFGRNSRHNRPFTNHKFKSSACDVVLLCS